MVGTVGKVLVGTHVDVRRVHHVAVEGRVPVLGLPDEVKCFPVDVGEEVDVAKCPFQSEY